MELQFLSENWRAFWEKHKIIELHEFQAPASGEESSAYCFILKEVKNLVVPEFNLPNYSLAISLNITLYYAGRKKWFGGQYKSPILKRIIQPNEPQTIAFEDLMVVFHSPIIDPSVHAIVEIVCNVEAKGYGIRPFGLGWTFIPIFGRRDLTDFSQDKNGNPMSAPLLKATPRALLYIDGALDYNKDVVKINESNLHFLLCTFNEMNVNRNLLRPNELVGEHDPVGDSGGTASSRKIYEKSIHPETQFSQIEEMETVSISNIQLYHSSANDAAFLQIIDSERKEEFGITKDDGRSPVILQKRLSIGISNGREFIEEPASFSLTESRGLFTYPSKINLKPYARNPLFAIVIQFEYVVRIFFSEQITSEYTDKVVPLGWYPLVASDGYNFHSGNISFDLFTGPGKAPIHSAYLYPQTGIKIELKLEGPDSAIQEQEENEYINTKVQQPKNQLEDEELTKSANRKPKMVTKEPEDDMFDENMENIPTNPNYPIAPRIGSSRAVSQMSRADKVRIYEAGFQEILDRHGKKPFEISLHQQTDVDLSLEDADSLSSNEIIFQFLAFSEVQNIGEQFLNAPKSVKSLFFSFQFYKYPMIVTERLLLESKNSEDEDSAQILMRLNEYNKPIGQKGLQIRFFGDGPVFSKYLESKVLVMDVWDGESLLQLGSVGIELKHILRQKREGVIMLEEFDILLPEYDEYIQNPDLYDTSYASMIRGKLHLRIANVGRPPEGTPEGRNVYVVEDYKNRKQNEMKKVLAKKMIEVDKELALALQHRKLHENLEFTPEIFARDAEEIDIKKRKKARYEMMRRITKKTESKPTSESRREKEKELKLVQLYRDKDKKDLITIKLKENFARIHKIYPSFGVPIFFEYVFHNPYNEDHVFTINIEDPELSLVKDSNEWRYFKRTLGVATPTEDNLLQGNKLLLKPAEIVYIPFKFQSYNTGQVIASPYAQQLNTQNENPLRNIPQDEPIKARTIPVMFLNTQSRPVVILEVQVFPQPFIVDRNFRFYSAENDFLKKNIRIANRYNPNTSLVTQKYIHCSNSKVTIVPPKSADISEVSLKFRCGPSPQISRFYLLLYNDAYKTSIYETWQIFVHSLARIDISGYIGQSTLSSLIQRGSSTARVAQSFTSHPDELIVNPHPTALVANALNQFDLRFKPLRTGSRDIYVHIVDIEFHILLSAWLVAGKAEKQAVTKQYNVKLKAGKPSVKNLGYTNPLTTKRTLTLTTNKPYLLSFKESKFEIGPREEKQLGLIFKPTKTFGTVPILVFLNDAEYDKTEECIAITAAFAGDE